MSITRLPGALTILSSIALACGAFAAACGGSSDGSSLFGPEADASDGAPPDFDSGQFQQNEPDAGASDASCSPAPLAATFKPTWRPPNGLHSNACTDQQMSDFFDACLTPPVDPAKCTTFTQANASCVTCLQSDDTDPSYGPVIWHSHRAFYTLNVPGCIADEQGDTSPQSCGAAYQADLECKQTACTGCFADPNTSFSKFAACESQASQECGTYATALHDTCGSAIHDAGSPASTCLPPSNTPTKTVYGIYAPLFCGKP